MASDSETLLDSETFSLSEFVEYMKPEKLVHLSPLRQDANCNWVFWSQDKDEGLGGTLDHSKRIKDMLLEVPFDRWRYCLMQFWGLKRTGDRYFLTTSHQPFALYELSKKCGFYRKRCVEKHIYLREEGDEEEQEEEKEALGPIGRAFRNKLPESSPEVGFYSRQEFPLVDHAAISFSQGLTALPVFEIESQNCVGVLEILGSPVDKNSLDTDILSFERHLEVAGLALNHQYLKPVPEDQPESWSEIIVSCLFSEDQPDSWNEIKEAFRVVAQTHPLRFALVFVPPAGCWENDGCGRDSSDPGLLKLAFSEKSSDYRVFYNEFINAHQAFHLKKGKGVSGKAFASLRSCFCRNIRDFTLTEYPLVHYARLVGLDLSFAICLQTTKLKKDLLVLEFFLSLEHSFVDLFSSLQSLLAKFKEHIPSFGIVAEDVPIEELFPKGRKSSNSDEVDNLSQTLQSRREYEQLDTFPELLQNGFDFPSFPDDFGFFFPDPQGHDDKLPPSSSGSPWTDPEVFDNTGCDISGSECGLSDIEGLTTGSVVPVTHAENSASTKRQKRQAEGKPPSLSREEIELQFDKPLSGAAKCLGVSESTLKRYCRFYGIRSWPRSKKNKGDIHTVSAMQSTEGGEVSISVPGTPSSLNLSSQENVQPIGPVSPNTGSSTQNFSTVDIKVSYGGRWIRFRLRSMATLAELEQEVAKRLKLIVGSFTITYDDEEDVPITITCDEDLQYCVEIMTSIGRTSIKMAVQLNCDLDL